MRMRTSLLAAVLLGLVLIGLGFTSWSGLSSIRHAQDETLRVRQSGIAYSDVRVAVAGEALAEAGYRRAPSTAARHRLDQAIAEVDRKLAAAHAATSRRDGPVLANLKLLNQRYVDQILASLGQPARGADDRVAGPALDAMWKLLDAAILGHRADLMRATASEIAVANRLRWMLPLAFGVALVVVAGTLRMLVREQRRVDEIARTRAEQVDILRDLERSREDFLAMVSHDLVNPITVIDWYAEMITETDDPAEAHRQAEVIRTRASQVKRLVADLGSGASPSTLVDAVQLDLADVVRDAVDGSVARAASTGIILTSRTAPAVIHGDPDRLRQVIDNLLGNAIKYTPGDGSVDVEVFSTDGGDAVVRISDTGIGIPADQLDLVFDTYYRASTATSEGIPGTGLGLAITKSIIDGHHGSIRAMAAEPRGTSFEFRIPLAEQPVTGSGDEPRLDPGRPPTVLVP